MKRHQNIAISVAFKHCVRLKKLIYINKKNGTGIPTEKKRHT